jgi:hypothetical protein
MPTFKLFQDCERINDTCCNYTSCMLYPEAQCSDGACCSNCQVGNSFVNNRSKMNEFDLKMTFTLVHKARDVYECVAT